MKSFRFASFAWIATLSLVLLVGAARAEEGDALPSPQEETDLEVPSVSEPSPQEPLFDTEESLPQPSLGEEPLPEPQGGPRPSEANQVNQIEDPDDVFLPAPTMQDSMNYTAAPTSSQSVEDYNYAVTRNRPPFILQLGLASRNYPTTLVMDRVTGYSVAGSVRVFNIAQTVFLHGYAGLSFFGIGDVGQLNAGGYRNLKDRTLHLGGILEVGIGRRLSLLGTLMHRSNYLTAAPIDSSKGEYHDPRTYLTNIGEEPAMKLGLGLQYDFYVIPHGSMGLRLHVEQDIAMAMLTMAIEPVPRKKLNLNYEDEIR